MQSIRIEALDFHARAALGAAAQAEGRARGRLLNAARNDARKMLDENVSWATNLGELALAAVAAARGDRDGAVERLREVVGLMTEREMGLHAAAARVRLDHLLGGDGEEGRTSLRERGVVAPTKMLRMLSPGPWPTAVC